MCAANVVCMQTLFLFSCICIISNCLHVAPMHLETQVGGNTTSLEFSVILPGELPGFSPLCSKSIFSSVPPLQVCFLITFKACSLSAQHLYGFFFFAEHLTERVTPLLQKLKVTTLLPTNMKLSGKHALLVFEESVLMGVICQTGSLQFRYTGCIHIQRS